MQASLQYNSHGILCTVKCKPDSARLVDTRHVLLCENSFGKNFDTSFNESRSEKSVLEFVEFLDIILRLPRKAQLFPRNAKVERQKTCVYYCNIFFTKPNADKGEWAE